LPEAVEGGGASCRNGGRKMVAVKPWARARRRPLLSEGARRGLGASIQTGSPTDGSRAVFDFFFNLSKTGSTLNIQNWCLILLQKFPIFSCGYLGYYEQFSQLCRHPILNINRAKNLGPDLTFESLINFKRDLQLPKKSGKFSKIHS
jgi:hypothetical protein